MKFRGGEFSTGTTGNFQSELTTPWYQAYFGHDRRSFGNGLCVGEDDDRAPELAGTRHITGQPTWVLLESEAGSWGLVWRLAGDPFLENEAARVPFVL